MVVDLLLALVCLGTFLVLGLVWKVRSLVDRQRALEAALHKSNERLKRAKLKLEQANEDLTLAKLALIGASAARSSEEAQDFTRTVRLTPADRPEEPDALLGRDTFF